MTGATRLAFLWMAGQAHRWQKQSDAQPPGERRDRLADVARAYANSAEKLKMYDAMPVAEIVRLLSVADGPNRLAEIVGKWPGEETDEQIREALEALS